MGPFFIYEALRGRPATEIMKVTNADTPNATDLVSAMTVDPATAEHKMVYDKQT
tara:strand:- start:147 stop:308 length:162 start_codon:yes stop_codon:yes gene_type:complete